MKKPAQDFQQRAGLIHTTSIESSRELARHVCNDSFLCYYYKQISQDVWDGGRKGVSLGCHLRLVGTWQSCLDDGSSLALHACSVMSDCL